MKFSLWVVLLISFLVSLHGQPRELVENFAKALFANDKGEFIAVVQANEYLTQDSIPSNQRPIFKNPDLQSVCDQFPLLLREVTKSYGTPTERLIFIKSPPGIVGAGASRVGLIPIYTKTIWLLILQPVFDENGGLILTMYDSAEEFKGIEAYKSLIDKNNFFQIPLPEDKNAVCIERGGNNSIAFSHIFDADPSILEDVQTLSDLACQKKNDAMALRADLSKAAQNLRTAFGRQLAKAGLSLLEERALNGNTR